MERISLSVQLCTRCYRMLSTKSCVSCAGTTYFTSPSAMTMLNTLKTKPMSTVAALNVMSSCPDNRKSPHMKGNYFGKQNFGQLFVLPQPQNYFSRTNLSSLVPQAFGTQMQGRTFSTELPKPPNPLPPRKKSRDQEKSPMSWRNLFIVAGLAGALLMAMRSVKKEKELEKEKQRNRLIGKAKLGGDWTLTDHHGKERSSTEFRGQWILIYFGFTNCPDICPEEIEKIVSVIDKTDKDTDLPTIQPIVITVDPERDTPEALKEYCAEFSPRLLGFTGTSEQIDAATRAFRVYYSAGPKDEENDYIVDHSIISYLMNPRGEFVDYFGQNKTAQQMYSSIKLHIHSYNLANK